MNILITGGAGYIGSHTAVELLDEGQEVIIVDDLSNSSAESIERIQQITSKEVYFYKYDLCDEKSLETVFKNHHIDAVIHFAGLKAVGESVEKPLDYYDVNINSTISLLRKMHEHSVNKLVFSSSATVYGNPGTPEYVEALPAGQNISNPYGKTKFMIEQIITDFCQTNPDFEATILRYFNPIGAHPSGLIGEDPTGIPNNLLPFISQVAVGKRDSLSVFGDDYETPDGTCVRDYLHVVDLARGHSAAIKSSKKGVRVYNLGSGKGHSVLEVIRAFEKSSGVKIPYVIANRRDGDLAEFYANPTKANDELGWYAEKSIEEACADAWRWQSKNPSGYSSK